MARPRARARGLLSRGFRPRSVPRRPLGERKASPANTFARLLGIVLIPCVGVPLYLMFGGRKLRQIARRKSRILPILPTTASSPSAYSSHPVARTVVAAGAYPPVGGNSLRLLPAGEAEFGELASQILSARHTIHTAFILGRDPTGRRLVNLLAERARAGVKVRHFRDRLGCLTASRGFVRLGWRSQPRLRISRARTRPQTLGRVSASCFPARPSPCSKKYFPPTGASPPARRPPRRIERFVLPPPAAQAIFK